jgi:DNA-binding transcriptional regulator YiaG
MELGLFQRDLRERFKLEKETYANWEKGRCKPAIRHWPGIIEFLGYDPNSEPKTTGERLVTYRRRLGLSRVALAQHLNVDDTTLWRWEIGERQPECQRHIDAVRRLVSI